MKEVDKERKRERKERRKKKNEINCKRKIDNTNENEE